MSDTQPTHADGTAPTDKPSDTLWERDALKALLTEQVKVSRANRRWRWIRFLSFLAVVGVFFWWAFRDVGQPTMVSTPHTAVVTVSGEIAADSEANAEDINQSMRAAFEDEGAQAVVLLINSPGGSPVQAGLINDEIRRLKALHKKPIYVVVEESCASAAYYIAAAADKIYVDKASIVGSIGVLMDGFGFTGLMDKLGVERRLMTAGANKGFLDPFSPQTEAQRKHAQAMLDQIHSQFIQVVRQGRGDRLKETPDMFSGLFWSGQQAVDMGLADAMGSLDSVAREVVKTPEVIDYSRHENVAERLAKRFGAAVGEGAVHALRMGSALR